MNRQTYHAKNDEVEQAWLHVDASDQVLGRLATRLAVILMGKHKPQYTPHHDVGDYIVVTNAEKVRLTGNKLDQKLYRTYSGHPSGQKTKTYRQMLEEKPELLVQAAVRRMLPKNKLGVAMLKKLKVYAGPEHPHQAQNPKPLELQNA
ncbi:MAG: 50S ribosomal protein L13 [Phycisphaeraceae bacterium]